MSGLFAALVASATGRSTALTPPPRPRFAAEEPFAQDDAPAEWLGADKPEPARIGVLDSRRNAEARRPAAARGDQFEQPDGPDNPVRPVPHTATERQAGEPVRHGEGEARRQESLLPPQERQPSPASGEAPERVSRETLPPAADGPPIASEATLLPLVPASRPPREGEEPRATRPHLSQPAAADNANPEIRIGRIDVTPPAPSAAAKASPARAQRLSRAPVRSSLDDYLARGRR